MPERSYQGELLDLLAARRATFMPDDIENLSLESYDKYIAGCADALRRGSQSRIIFNKSQVHASILICHLINTAEKEIRILSGNLDAGVYENPYVISEAVDFVRRRNGSIRVLLDLRGPIPPMVGQTLGDLLVSNRFLSALKETGRPGQLSIQMVPSHVADAYPFHFLVVDCRSFRFEQDRDKLEAIAQFGNSAFAGDLCKKFDEIWGWSIRP